MTVVLVFYVLLERKFLPMVLLARVTAISLIAAIIPVWPYPLYILLRFLAFCVMIALAVFLYRGSGHLKRHVIILSILAFLFNPLFIFHLSRILWAPIDIGVALYLLWLVRNIENPPVTPLR